MAFTPSTLSVILQTIGGVGMRFVSYRTDDSIATASATGYFADGESYGLRINDLIFVSPVLGTVEPYLLVVTDVDANGDATAVQTAFDAELTVLAGLDKSDGNFIVGNGTTWVAENGATARASLGLGSAAVLDAPDDDDLANDGTKVALRKNVKAYADAIPTLTPVADQAAIAALSPTKKAAYLLATGQSGPFEAIDNTGGDYDDDLTDDVNGGFVVDGTSPYVWVRRPDWYLDGEHFQLGATSDDTDAMQGFLDISARRARVALIPMDATIVTETVDIPSHTRLKGFGKRSIWQAKSTLGTSSRLFKNPNQSAYTDENIWLKDFAVDGNGLGNEDSGTQTRLSALLSFIRVQNLKMEGLIGYNLGYIMFGLSGCKDWVLRGGEFYDIGFIGSSSNAGVAVWSGQPDGTDLSERGTISGVYFHDLEWSPIQANGDDLLIKGCRAVDVKEAFIYSSHNPSSDASLVSRNLRVMHNRVKGVRLKDIAAVSMEFDGTQGVVVAGNQIEDCDHGGIAFTNAKRVDCYGNQVKNVSKLNTGSCIDVISTRANPDGARYIKVHNNRLYDDQGSPTTRRAIRVYSSGSGEDPFHVEIHDNDCAGTTFTQSPVIQISNATSSGVGALVRRGNRGSGDEYAFLGAFAVSATGSVSITGCPFPPREIRALACRSSTSTNASIGVSTVVKGPQTRGIAVGVGASGGGGGQSHSAAFKIIDGTSTTICEATITSFNSDGATFNVSTNSGTNVISYACYP